jgi:hypothetical protein
VASDEEEIEELEDEDEDDDEIDDDTPLEELALADDDDEEEIEDDDASAAALPDEEDEGDEASLEELLAERSAARPTGDDVDEDEDLMALVPEPDVALDEVVPVRVVPVKDEEEFVCARCHLVKKKVQLVDADRRLCRDCA